MEELPYERTCPIMRHLPVKKIQKTPGILKRIGASSTEDNLRHLAFDTSMLANIITRARTGQIIMANGAARKLLGYSQEELLSRNMVSIFDINESSFKMMLKQRTAEGHSKALVTVIKKSGSLISCEITSAVFVGEHNIKKAITTIVVRSQAIDEQKNIDDKNKKIVADDIVLAKSIQKRIDEQKEKIVNDNIFRARSNQKGIDAKNKKIVADDIVLAKSNQKKIDIVKEKAVSDDIMLAQAGFEARLEREIKLKGKQIEEASEDAKGMERSKIGKELHDNVNQLLSASRLYLDMAKRGGGDTANYLNRSSEYILIAIEEIRKLTKGLAIETIKNIGLWETIGNTTRDIMEAAPVKISCVLHSFTEDSVSAKFKQNAFRIVQEQLNNILKHAHATEVTISLSQNKKSTILAISDNGIGFNPGKKHKGIGLANIKNRSAAYNGTAVFVSEPGYGCELTVTFPLSGSC